MDSTEPVHWLQSPKCMYRRPSPAPSAPNLPHCRSRHTAETRHVYQAVARVARAQQMRQRRCCRGGSGAAFTAIIPPAPKVTATAAPIAAHRVRNAPTLLVSSFPTINSPNRRGKIIPAARSMVVTSSYQQTCGRGHRRSQGGVSFACSLTLNDSERIRGHQPPSERSPAGRRCPPWPSALHPGEVGSGVVEARLGICVCRRELLEVVNG